MTHFKAIVCSIFGLFVCVSNFSHAQDAYTLEKAVADALLFDGRVGAAESSLDVTQEGVRQVYGLRLPSLSGIGEFDFQGTKDLNPFGSFQQNGPRAYAGLELNQQLVTFGRQTAKQKRARAEVTRASQELIQTKLDVANETIEAFLNVLLVETQMDVYQNHVDTLAQLLVATEAKFEADLTTQTDVLLVKSRYQQAEARLTTTRANLNSARNKLLSLTGVDFKNLEQVNGAQRGGGEASLDGALSFAGLYVPMLLIAEAEIEIAKANVDLEKAELYPNASLRGRFSRGTSDGRPTGSDSIGLSLNIPLYNGGIQRSRSRASKHQLSQTQRQASFTLELVRQKITGAWHQTRGADEAYKAWETALASELKSLEGLQEEVDEGIRPIQYLLEAKDQAVEVQILTARAKNDLHLSNYIFLKESGRLLESFVN